MEKHIQSMNYYREALRIYKLKEGKDHISVARTLDRMGSVYINMEKYDAALSTFHNCLEIYQRHLGDKDQDLADVFFNIGIIQRINGQYNDASEQLKRCLGIRKHLGTDHISVVSLNLQSHDTMPQSRYYCCCHTHCCHLVPHFLFIIVFFHYLHNFQG